MGNKSKIEWTDATWNPTRGCSVVSEGCRNCYAMQVAARFSGEAMPYEGLAYRNGSSAHWTGRVKLIEEHLEDPLRWKRPRLIFVNSMSDLFHESILDEWIDRIFAVMALTPRHMFQVLTKRPERMRAYLSARMVNVFDAIGVAYERQFLDQIRFHRPEESRHNPEWPLRNAWLGVSCEDQKTADERIPLLLQTPAAVRWISAEPLLGPIALSRWMGPFEISRDDEGNDLGSAQGGSDLDWVVVGGESGPGARPMHPDWPRSLRDQCAAAGVSFFFKQWGAWSPVCALYPQSDAEHDEHEEAGCCGDIELQTNGIIPNGYQPSDPRTWLMDRVGKKAAGRVLDGREWNEYPQSKAQTQVA